MNILMIAPEPFLEPRGTPISIYDRLSGLSALGHTVDLVTYHLGQDVEIEGVRIIRIPALSFIREISIGPSPAKILLDVLLFFKSLQMLIQNRYQAIHSHEEAAYFSIALSKFFRIPHIYDMHSSLPKQLAISKFRKLKPVIWLFNQLEKVVLVHSDAIIAIASELEDHILQINPHANVTIIENIALSELYGDLPASSPQDLKDALSINGQQIIIYTGNFEPYQGLDLLVDSAEIVCRQNSNAVFVLVGGHPAQIDQLSKKVKSMGLSKRFVFTGRVSPDQVSKYLNIAHVLVSPRSDGLPVPLKIYSYLYTGKPVLATNIAAHKGFSGYDHMLLADPHPEQFAQGLMDALELSKHLPTEGFITKKRKIAEEKINHYLSSIERAYRSVSFSEDFIAAPK
jgi:glycosyltransferase involved in cell wall biosynthesis